MWQEYKDLFDQVHASEALRMEVKGMTGKAKAGGRRRATARQIVLIAAVIALLGTAAVAAVVAGPTLRDHLFGEGTPYDRSSAPVGKSVTVDGWTATITDCVGDDYTIYLGIEVEAPEGTVLDRDDYWVWVDCTDDNEQMAAGTFMGALTQLPDKDPTDNRVQFYYTQGAMNGGETGITLQFKLADFFHNSVWNEAKKDYDVTNLWEGTWDFGEVTLNFTDTTRRVYPNLPLGRDGAVVLEEIDVSPLGVHAVLSGAGADEDQYQQHVIKDGCLLRARDGRELSPHIRSWAWNWQLEKGYLGWVYEDGVLLDVSEIESVTLCGQTFLLE